MSTKKGHESHPQGAPPERPQAADVDAALAGSVANADRAATAGSAAADDAEAEAQRLRADLEEAGDRLLRAQAELENYRRRARRELEDERKYAAMPLLRDLLPVFDNVRRAIEAAERTSEGSSLLEGFRMVSQAFDAALARHHCQRIDALHKPFDPTYHEAISQQPSNELGPNVVLMVVQEGFMLHDRVVRPAQVIVSSGPPQSAG